MIKFLHVFLHLIMFIKCINTMRENVNLGAGRRKYIIHEISHVSDNKTNMHVFRVKFFVEQAIQYENQCLKEKKELR